MSIAEQLQQRRRNFSMPTEITLANGETLLGTKILRVLPGKRMVMEAQWQDQPVLVKLMLNTVAGRRNMQRELAGYRILKSAEIITPELLLTARCNDGSHVLVFEYLQQAQRLGDLWQDQVGGRQKIITICLSLISRLHEKGCNQTDFHLHNFLLAKEQLYVIDTASVKHQSNTVYGKWQRENLALFLAQFPPLPRKTVMASLKEHYEKAADDPKLEKAIERAWKRRKSYYLKKCFRESSEFCAHTNWYFTATWKRAHHSADLISFLQEPDTWIEKGKMLKDGNSSTVVSVQMGGRLTVIKRNNIKGIGHRLRRCLRTTRSYANWRNAHLLKINGILTPDPIAFMEKRRGLFRSHGYYVCALSDFPSAAEKYKSRQPTQQELTWFEELFAGMRMARLYHGDFKASNLFITDKGIELIDLDSIKECHQKKGLLQKDQRRFLKNWQDKPKQLKLFSEIFSKT